MMSKTPSASQLRSASLQLWAPSHIHSIYRQEKTRAGSSYSITKQLGGHEEAVLDAVSSALADAAQLAGGQRLIGVIAGRTTGCLQLDLHSCKGSTQGSMQCRFAPVLGERAEAQEKKATAFQKRVCWKTQWH